MEKSLKAGIVQLDVRLGDIRANVRNAIAGIAGLGKRGARLAVLPELWASGFDNKRIAEHADRTPEIIETIASEAARHKTVIAGSLAEICGNAVCNTLVVIDSDGSIAGRYAKVHLFSATGEDRYFARGDSWTVCETSIGRLGLLICYDLRFPELSRILALNGAECLVVCAQWPAERISHWETLARARAIENQIFLLASNRCGSDPNIVYGGRSLVVSPTGEILASGHDQKPDIIDAILDRSVMEKFRTRIPCLDERVPDVYAGTKGEK